MLVEPGVTQIGRRGLDLDGWGDLSVWGWDSQTGTLFAQLWRDRPDDEDDEDDETPGNLDHPTRMGSDRTASRPGQVDRGSHEQLRGRRAEGNGPVSTGPGRRRADGTDEGVKKLGA